MIPGEWPAVGRCQGDTIVGSSDLNHRQWRLPLAVALTAALLGGPRTACLAADTAEAGSTDAYQLQEVVVTSTRHEENLSKVPISVTAMTQEEMDTKGIKDISDLARFTPGINVADDGTHAIAIRGIASSGGAGTTGIYIDETPIQMRALAFNPDETLPQTFDVERVEVLRGPQGTLFGAGSEGGTVRYITTQPSLNTTSVYSRFEGSWTQGGHPSFEAGIAAGGPIIEDKLGARATVWYRSDGGWIDRVNPTATDPQNAVVDHDANRNETILVRLAGVWAATDQWTVTPSIYYQNRRVHDADTYWPIYSDPGSNKYVSGAPQAIQSPDEFYLPALKIQGHFDAFDVISNTSYFHRVEQSGYDGTLYNLEFYQLYGPAQQGYLPPGYDFLPGNPYPLLDGSGIHLPASIANYRSPATVDNDQQNLTQEIRIQSNDNNARLRWTAGLFFGLNHQQYLEQIHDPMLNDFWLAEVGIPYTSIFVDPDGNPVTYDPSFPNDSYFLQTHSKDQQIALFGDANYELIDGLRLELGARWSNIQSSFNTLTGGPQLFLQNQTNSGDKREDSFTPKVNLSWQIDPNNLVYATYAKGFRPGGANNPVPYSACSADFQRFGILGAPATYNSDTVNSYEIGAKDNIANRMQIATSIYYIQWNNIQQRLIPPSCQISFIANLGHAVAKGADFQGDFLITQRLKAELTAGFTSARFTSDSAFTTNLDPANVATQPIVRSGNAITGEDGQPIPPWTAAVALEYHFQAFARESFVRADYQYQGRAKWAPAQQDPNTLLYDPGAFTLPSTSFVSLRAGTKFDQIEVEPFIDNLLDAHPVTNYNLSIPNPGYSRLQTNYTFRPRTFGITFTVRR
jgi:outer membrane receptor protein involved in Fe transport